MMTSVFLIVAGFVLLIVGADFIVKGSVAIANKLKVPPLIIGLTIVAFGTSAPEFVVSVTSALQGAEGLVLGNVVGSNIANILLILGGAAIVYPIAVDKKSFYRDFSFLLFVSIVFTLFALSGTFVRWMGILMLLMLIAFVVLNYYSAKKSGQTDIESSTSPWNDKGWLFVIGGTVLGLAGIVYGADLLVDGAVMIAQYFGVSEEIIGLTIIAFGTSLPELATSCVAAYRKQSDLAVGNVLGSNIWNIVFILGVAATITDVSVPTQFIRFDIWIMLAATVVLLPRVYRYGKISRTAGVLFVLSYILYLVAQILISRGIWVL